MKRKCSDVFGASSQFGHVSLWAPMSFSPSWLQVASEMKSVGRCLHYWSRTTFEHDNTICMDSNINPKIQSQVTQSLKSDPTEALRWVTEDPYLTVSEDSMEITRIFVDLPDHLSHVLSELPDNQVTLLRVENWHGNKITVQYESHERLISKLGSWNQLSGKHGIVCLTQVCADAEHELDAEHAFYLYHCFAIFSRPKEATFLKSSDVQIALKPVLFVAAVGKINSESEDAKLGKLYGGAQIEINASISKT